MSSGFVHIKHLDTLYVYCLISISSIIIINIVIIISSSICI